MNRCFLLVAIAILIISGCSGCKVGDGEIDTVEEGAIRVAVGVTMSSQPESVRPAYAVSTALLKVISPDYVAEASAFDLAILRELDAIGLSGPERLTFMDLVASIRGIIIDQLKSSPNAESRRVVISQVLQIVRESAANRIALETQNVAVK